MSLENFILTCEKDNEQLRKDVDYYKNYNKRLKKENQQLKKQLEISEKAWKEAIEFINDPWILADYKIGSMLHDYKTRAIKILNVDKGE